MKKSIPFISPLVIGVFASLFVECLMCILSISASPFTTYKVAPFFYSCIFISVLAALPTIAIIIINMIYLVNLDNAQRAKLTIMAEIFPAIALFLFFWNIWSTIFNNAFYMS